ncbi:MAG: glycosyltransferase family 4 protein [Dehalococcoidia bacterium]
MASTDRRSTTRNVLFVTWQYFPMPAGGAEHQARLQAEELARRGHRVTVLCRSSAEAGSGAVNGVAVHRLPAVDRRPFRTLTFLCSLAVYLLLRVRHADVVHVHLAGLYTDLVVLIASWYGVPVYLKIAAGGESGEVRKLRRFARVTRFYGLRHAARVQALSDEIAAELRDAGVPPGRIVRIPNGVLSPAPRDARDRAGLRAGLELPEDGLVVLYMGRFSRYKGVADLVEAWRRVPAEDARLLLVGYRADHPPEDQLDLAPGSPALPGNVVVHEWTTRAADYLAAADVFVLPSHSEGMSNALLEALAGSLPTVATRVGAATTLIDDGVNGLLVDAGEPAQLADALTRILADGVLRQRLAGAAAITGREYSVDAVVDRLEETYAAMRTDRQRSQNP